MTPPIKMASFVIFFEAGKSKAIFVDLAVLKEMNSCLVKG